MKEDAGLRLHSYSFRGVMKKRLALIAAAIIIPAALVVVSMPASAEEDPAVVAMNQINAQLAAQGLAYRAEAIEFFTIGNGRPSARILGQPFRWVAGDPRRLAE